MIIQLNADWRITSDALQWIVHKRKVVRGEERWQALSYHKDVAGALVYAGLRRVREISGIVGPEGLQPLVSALDAIRADINRALADVPRAPPKDADEKMMDAAPVIRAA